MRFSSVSDRPRSLLLATVAVVALSTELAADRLRIGADVRPTRTPAELDARFAQDDFVEGSGSPRVNFRWRGQNGVALHPLRFEYSRPVYRGRDRLGRFVGAIYYSRFAPEYSFFGSQRMADPSADSSSPSTSSSRDALARGRLTDYLEQEIEYLAAFEWRGLRRRLRVRPGIGYREQKKTFRYEESAFAGSNTRVGLPGPFHAYASGFFPSLRVEYRRQARSAVALVARASAFRDSNGSMFFERAVLQFAGSAQSFTAYDRVEARYDVTLRRAAFGIEARMAAGGIFSLGVEHTSVSTSYPQFVNYPLIQSGGLIEVNTTEAVTDYFIYGERRTVADTALYLGLAWELTFGRD